MNNYESIKTKLLIELNASISFSKNTVGKSKRSGFYLTANTEGERRGRKKRNTRSFLVTNGSRTQQLWLGIIVFGPIKWLELSFRASYVGKNSRLAHA